MAAGTDMNGDAILLPDGFYDAGREYLWGLRRLGLRPEHLTWAYERAEDRFVLLLVWAGVETFGPLELAELLFKAYRDSTLTRKVDPFSVHAVSDYHAIGHFVSQVVPEVKRKGLFSAIMSTYDEGTGVRESDKENFLFQVKPEWSYVRTKRRPAWEQELEWKRFRRNVLAKAA